MVVGHRLRTSLRARNRVPNKPGGPTLNSSVASPISALSGDLRQKVPRSASSTGGEPPYTPGKSGGLLPKVLRERQNWGANGGIP
eukprot:15451265-Alexandrium_andersonii.AAC.2